MPLFSIVIPTYNRGNFLPQTINSVLMQDFEDFEILLIDDGSTDNTAEVIRPFTEKESRVKYYYKENAERGAARNFGIKNSTGNYVIFLDSDDEFLQGHLTEMKKLIVKYPKINFFATKFQFSEDGQIFKAPIDNLSPGIYDYRLLMRGNPFACNICIRKNNEALRLFPEDRLYASMEDWIFLFSNLWSQDLYLSGKTTVQMNEHPNRSMRFNKIIVTKRLVATEYILKNFSLLKKEKEELKGYTAYFCAIHSYLDNERGKSLTWAIRSMKSLGIKKNLI
jgi:glycosyltransferase involved in cell wall biosynthesis